MSPSYKVGIMTDWHPPKLNLPDNVQYELPKIKLHWSLWSSFGDKTL